LQNWENGRKKTENRIQESRNEDVCFGSSDAGLSSTKGRFRIDNCDLRLRILFSEFCFLFYDSSSPEFPVWGARKSLDNLKVPRDLS
jgi:hypothetical protein